MTILNLTVLDTDVGLTVTPRHLVVAGYTGRDQAAVQAHIDELAAIGVPPPPEVPMFYSLDPELLTLGDVNTVGAATGEVEPMLLRSGGRWYLGLASDLTDRELERDDIEKAKAACPKPVGNTVVSLPDHVVAGHYDDTWDLIEATSSVDGEPYQRGSLAALRAPGDLLSRLYSARPEVEGDEDLVVLAGTLPLLAGGFRRGSTWEAQLSVPGGVTLTHTHTHTHTHTPTTGRP